MFNNYIKDIKSHWKIIRCRFSGKHQLKTIMFAGRKYRGCKTCDLWRWIQD